MRLTVIICLSLFATISPGSEIIVAGEHILVTPENFKNEGICISVQTIGNDHFLDIFVPEQNRNRNFYHVWVAGHDQFGVTVVPKKYKDKYAIQINGTAEQLRKVDMGVTYTEEGFDIATYNIEFHSFISDKGEVIGATDCGDKVLSE